MSSTHLLQSPGRWEWSEWWPRPLVAALRWIQALWLSQLCKSAVEKCPSVPVGTGFNPSIWSLEQLWVSGMARAPTPTCPAVLKQLLWAPSLLPEAESMLALGGAWEGGLPGSDGQRHLGMKKWNIWKKINPNEIFQHFPVSLAWHIPFLILAKSLKTFVLSQTAFFSVKWYLKTVLAQLCDSVTFSFPSGHLISLRVRQSCCQQK